MLRFFPVMLVAACWLTASAQEMLDEVHLKFQYYDDNNRVTVGKPLIRVNKTLGGQSAVGAHFTVDGISGASRVVRYPALSVDAVTSASETEARKEFGVRAVHQTGQTRISISGARSDEKDYFSRSGTLALLHDLFHKSTVLDLRYTLFDDEYDPVEEMPSFEHVDDRFIVVSPGFGEGGRKSVHNTALGWTQTIGRRTFGKVSANATLSRGYLSRPYYRVLVEDTAVSSQDPEARGGMLYLESCPDSRDAYAGIVLLRQHYPSLIREGSAQLEYRRYWDNWGISSNTLSLLLSQYLHTGVFLQVGYRFYAQSSALFYRDRYTQKHTDPDSRAFLSYLTVDPRLSEFDSHMLQAKLVFMVRNFVKPNTGGLPALFPSRFDVEVERYVRGTSSDSEVRRRRYEYYGEEGLEAWIIRGGLVFYY